MNEQHEYSIGAPDAPGATPKYGDVGYIFTIPLASGVTLKLHLGVEDRKNFEQMFREDRTDDMLDDVLKEV